MNFVSLENKKVRVILNNGDFFEGLCTVNSAEYNMHEFGREETALQIADYLFYESEIQSFQLLKAPENGCDATDIELLMRFSLKRSFSEHLMRWEDNELPDKYDHNFFEYSEQPVPDEVQKAVFFQKERGDSFLKLQGAKPLQNSFGLSPSVTLSMELRRDFRNWKIRSDLEFQKPSLSELKELELSHFGPAYGESFTRRNISRLYEELSYHGAYLNGELVGSCYTLSNAGYVCLDGLLVDIDLRRQGIATSLLAHIAESEKGKTLYLHADLEDEPRKLYEKLGFCEVSRSYEYLCTDLTGLEEQFLC